jgi:hypothetical protein
MLFMYFLNDFEIVPFAPILHSTCAVYYYFFKRNV